MAFFDNFNYTELAHALIGAGYGQADGAAADAMAVAVGMEGQQAAGAGATAIDYDDFWTWTLPMRVVAIVGGFSMGALYRLVKHALEKRQRQRAAEEFKFRTAELKRHIEMLKDRKEFGRRDVKEVVAQLEQLARALDGPYDMDDLRMRQMKIMAMLYQLAQTKEITNNVEEEGQGQEQGQEQVAFLLTCPHCTGNALAILPAQIE